VLSLRIDDGRSWFFLGVYALMDGEPRERPLLAVQGGAPIASKVVMDEQHADPPHGKWTRSL
jgi:hypothetical protein